MVRISKNSIERREEILDVAQNLFLSNGYEKTAVSDIVKKIGVAQGTFYYHFKSKEEVLNAILERCTYKIAKDAKNIANMTGLNAKQKLQKVIAGIINYKGWNGEMMELIHQDENFYMHQMIQMKSAEFIIPAIDKIISQGVEEGFYDTEWTWETAELIVFGIGGIYSDIKMHLCETKGERFSIEAIQNLIERLLETIKNTI